MDKTYKVFKLFYPDGGYGFAFVLLNPDENDLVIHKSRCVKIGNYTTFIPYGALPGKVLDDGARYLKPESHIVADMYEKIRKKRPHDLALLDFFWKTRKSNIIEYVGEVKMSDLKNLV
jgi:hypothetical protein